ncbi:hypothetical protein TIFTF001_019470 [Ficus carica]|uniref:Uncharacterized protein n=1 Tax=Ficus carica TaxID=3494 RepID=A0AA88ABT1_FICCA|nr:hypothetical protein TIFTF001_019470 [Ficus carica]
MSKHPRHCVTRTDVFKFPWIVIKPESVLPLGKVFLLVPDNTIRDLTKSQLRREQCTNSPRDWRNRDAPPKTTSPHKTMSPLKTTSPHKAFAGMTPRHQDHVRENTLVSKEKRKNKLNPIDYHHHHYHHQQNNQRQDNITRTHDHHHHQNNQRRANITRSHDHHHHHHHQQNNQRRENITRTHDHGADRGSESESSEKFLSPWKGQRNSYWEFLQSERTELEGVTTFRPEIEPYNSQNGSDEDSSGSNSSPYGGEELGKLKSCLRKPDSARKSLNFKVRFMFPRREIKVKERQRSGSSARRVRISDPVNW